jgi:hypothetical protein
MASYSRVRLVVPPPRGSALIFALCLVAVLAIAGIAIVRIAGNDSISASKLGIEDRGLACAEAGLQYARRFFGTNYDTSNGWNDYLDGTKPGFRYDPANFAGDATVTPDSLTTRAMNGTVGNDFRVSIRDDDDERPLGASDKRDHDNNEMVIIRSECINDSYAVVRGGVPTHVILESTLVHIQGSSGYATSGPSNAPDIVGER